MQATIDIYQDRIEEIELYYKALQELYDNKSYTENSFTFYKDDFLKILKSNALIMVYNLVESSIMSGIVEIYNEVKSEGLTYKNVTSEIKKIWFSYKFNEVYDKNADYNTYRNKATEIINSILSDDIIDLDKKATNICGNLDADKIRNICRDHGINYNVSTDCKGGIVLTDVKNKRNELAHGTISFVECGRDYTIDDLIKIKDQTVLFLKGIILGMKDYYDRHLYILSSL